MLKFKSVLMDENAVRRAMKRISFEIAEKNHGCDDLCIVGICRRGVPLAEMIADNMERNEGTRPDTGKIDISLYRDDIEKISSDPVVNGTSVPFSIKDKTVVLVDDVLFTGRTARAAIDALISLGRPAKVQLAVLVDRGHREFPIRADYVGKNVPTSSSEMIAVKVPEFDGEIAVEIHEIVN